MPTFVEIAVNVPQVREVFHYHLPEELEGQVDSGSLDAGHLVTVPFGKQQVYGVVLRTVEQPAVAETKPVASLVDSQPVLTAAQIRLAEALAYETLAPISTCIALMLPPGLAAQADTLFTLRLGQAGDGKFTPTQKRLVSLLEKRGPLRGGQIDAALPRTDWRPAARSLKRLDVVETHPVLPAPTVQPKMVRTVQLAIPPDQVPGMIDSLGASARHAKIAASPEKAESCLGELGKEGSKSRQRRLEMLGFLQRQAEAVEAAAVYTACGGSLADLKRLESLGLVTLSEQPSPREGRLRRILQFLVREPGPVDVAWVYAESGGNLEDLRLLAGRDLITLGESEVWRDPLADTSYQPALVPPLTRAQQAAWAQIQEALGSAAQGQAGAKERAAPPILLHGVTGSGKTEIYLRAVAETIRLGRQAIVLVPEISLTPQTVRRFAGRFPGQVGLVHSRLSAGERFDVWRRARLGKISLVIGPRSALFTPLPNLGLIVVDESHDDSYYQEEAEPHYHAREAAVVYARQCGAVCLMGSATPDLESTYRASQGQWKYLSLPHRVLAHQQEAQAQLERLEPAAGQTHPPERETIGSGNPAASGDHQAPSGDLPPTQVVDMRQELQAGNRSIFSRSLQAALGEVLAREQQAILFLNRRGTATYVFCRDCGFVLRCPHCDIPLTYHGPETALVCHRCGYQRKLPSRCPQCGSPRIRQYGTGTARVEEELQALYPQARILRWDWETTRQKGAHEVILAHFANHRADFLVGTQMLAKGLDLPLVTLVGVVLADVGLNLPDYRASERTFQLLTQVAGRAGRSPLGGQVILQTFQPEHYAIQAASRHDYRSFYQTEMAYRRKMGYPPFSRLVRLTYSHRDPGQAERQSQAMAARIRLWLEEGDYRLTSLIGPAPCFFARIAGLYRWQIVLRGPDPAAILRNRILGEWNIEVNPPNLL